jgi:hypothetical protein
VEQPKLRQHKIIYYDLSDFLEWASVELTEERDKIHDELKNLYGYYGYKKAYYIYEFQAKWANNNTGLIAKIFSLLLTKLPESSTNEAGVRVWCLGFKETIRSL